MLTRFRADLADLVAFPTELGADAAHAACLDHIAGLFAEIGFATEVISGGHPPIMLASRVEDAGLATLLSYSHADTVPGMDDLWTNGASPWQLNCRDGALFGRGVADNKGQFLVNLTALRRVLQDQGRLGFNLHWIVEMGEEVGSPGLNTVCADLKPRLRADLLLASDGPRIAADRATVFLGARGGLGVQLTIRHRVGGRHSGNFGGLLRNPGTEMAHVLTHIIGPGGACKVPEWVPEAMPAKTRAALAGIVPADGEIDARWGTPGLTPAERVYGWSAVEVLSLDCGAPGAPVNAIPPVATAHIQLRYVMGLDEDRLMPGLRAHLDAGGFDFVQIEEHAARFPASATPVNHPFVAFVTGSITRSTGAAPALLPSLGGSLPNHIFTETLDLPTVWVPHSYPGCNQHAADEHVPEALFASGIALMQGIFRDIGAASRADLGL
jgi:acetylornithine deacetylase/succinyl-diaminopimelate desuccinylase-like protein